MKRSKQILAVLLLASYAAWCASWLFSASPSTPDTNAEAERMQGTGELPTMVWDGTNYVRLNDF